MPHLRVGERAVERVGRPRRDLGRGEFRHQVVEADFRRRGFQERRQPGAMTQAILVEPK
jgi:hypothetical protein